MDGKRQTAVWMLVMLVSGAVLALLSVNLNGRAQPASIIIEPPAPTALPAPTATPRPLRVYISGAVLHPDVYNLPADSIVRDVVQMAGNFTAEAATEAVNLALPLADGMHVHIPAQDEVGAPPLITMPSAPVNSLDTAGAATRGVLININTATLEELDTLPGIGPSTAQKIIDHRSNHGPFPTIEAILDVSGIGPAKFEQIKALITVG
ncbi:MAG: helix-hairpin-helix domain-containing protein [Anaerolineae bacterium]|nr:helix-hairpin-helix domain-containing protein [Anaerolineae bacterium]